MDAKTYLKVSGINLIFLIAGTLLGPAIVNTSRLALSVVHAQSPPATKTNAPPPEDPNVEYVTQPSYVGSTLFANTFLASRIACDRLQVNGFDVLKLNDAILTALLRKEILPKSDVDKIVASGKADHPLRLKPTQ